MQENVSFSNVPKFSSHETHTGGRQSGQKCLIVYLDGIGMEITPISMVTLIVSESRVLSSE